MKIESKVVSVKPAFEPVQLTITFDTMEEMGMFYAIFNHTYIQDAVNASHTVDKLNTDKIRKALEKGNPDVQYNYQNAHKRLSQVLNFTTWPK